MAFEHSEGKLPSVELLNKLEHRSGRDPDGRGRDRVTGSPTGLRWQDNRERGGLHTKGPITDCCEVSAPAHHEDGYATRNRL